MQSTFDRGMHMHLRVYFCGLGTRVHLLGYPSKRICRINHAAEVRPIYNASSSVELMNHLRRRRLPVTYGRGPHPVAWSDSQRQLTASHTISIDRKSLTDITKIQEPTSSSSVSHFSSLDPASSDPPAPVSGTDSEECFYFAYGSNLHKDSLGRDTKVKSRLPATVLDPKVHLFFRHRGGGATLLRESAGDPRPMFSPPDGRVHGVLYRMANSELRKLKRDDAGYELTQIEVHVYEDDRGAASGSGKSGNSALSAPTTGFRRGVVLAWVYTSNSMARLPVEVVPTEAYMMKLREGAADQFLDPSYQAWLSSIETVSSAGLPFEYWNTPADNLLGGVSLLLVAALVALSAALTVLTRHIGLLL